MRALSRGLVLIALAAGLPAAASSVTIYRCVDAQGRVTLQNGHRCAKGMHEQSRIVETPAPARVRPAVVVTPAPPPTVEVPVMAMPAATAVPATTAPALPPTPAPPLFACGAETERYFSETADPAQCAPLHAVGLDGREMGAVAACEMHTDQCDPVPDADLCAAWAARRHAAESALQFSPEQFDAAKIELDRVNAATAGSVCAR